MRDWGFKIVFSYVILDKNIFDNDEAGASAADPACGVFQFVAKPQYNYKEAAAFNFSPANPLVVFRVFNQFEAKQRVNWCTTSAVNARDPTKGRGDWSCIQMSLQQR